MLNRIASAIVRAACAATLLAFIALPLGGCATSRPSDAAASPSIARVWTGYVQHSRADEYQAYLAEGITKFPTIRGNLGVQMLRRDLDANTTEFTVISYWPSMDSIKAYAGDYIDRPKALPRDPEFMISPGASVRHYTIEQWLHAH